MHFAEFTVEPFTPVADGDAIADLRTRLAAARWPDAPQGSGWDMGADVGYLRDLAHTWLHDFDWADALTTFTRFPQYRASLGPFRIHVIHARGVGTPRPMPLLLNHGWPDSSWRYLKAIPLLTDPGAHGGDPADAFDVIVPEMPGFGWSDAPRGAALDSMSVASL